MLSAVRYLGHTLSHQRVFLMAPPFFFQAPSRWTAAACPSPPTKAVRSWTWIVRCTLVVSQRKARLILCPPRCGQHLYVWVSWAACGTCLLTAGAGTCGVWLSCRVQQASVSPAHVRPTGAAAPSPVPTAATATKAGTDTYATALEPDTWDPTVKLVRVERL